MRVFRLEDKDGWGFWSGDSRGNLTRDHIGVFSKGNTMNYMATKLMRVNNIDYRYACDSLSSLESYFGTAWDDIMESGRFDVVEYEIRKSKYNIVYGDTGEELMFRLDKARCVTPGCASFNNKHQVSDAVRVSWPLKGKPSELDKLMALGKITTYYTPELIREPSQIITGGTAT